LTGVPFIFHRLRLVSRIAWAAFALFGIAWTVVLCTPLTAWYAMKLARASGWQRGDYPAGISGATVVLLGGSGGPMEGLGADSMIRCNRAVNYWRTGRVQRIIVTGFSVGAPMRDYLVGRGVPPTAVLLEPHARSTRQNALAVRALLPPGQSSLVVLSSDYHVFRASRAFRRAGLEATPAIAWDAFLEGGDWPERPTAMIAEAVESAKIFYYWARGWI
jgi:uncharacterized SAM-binding protein YcdF (DUF218 family)